MIGIDDVIIRPARGEPPLVLEQQIGHPGVVQRGSEVRCVGVRADRAEKGGAQGPRPVCSRGGGKFLSSLG